MIVPMDLRGTQETAGPPGLVLLIDDSVVTLDLISAFLHDLGWTVETAQSGAEAIARLDHNTPEVVVADLNMPDMNGIDVFRALHGKDPTLPVIILSAEDAVSRVLETMHAGVFDFVPKSDHVRMLPVAVTRAAAHCRLARENVRLAEDLRRSNEGLAERVRAQTKLIEEKIRRETRLEQETLVAALRRELQIAQHLQTFLQPRDLHVPGLRIAAGMTTATRVSGDYYDVRPTADGCWLGIGDVSGHGLDAGLVMLMIQSGLTSLILDSPDRLPFDVLPALNRMLHDNLRGRLGRDDHATLTLFRYFEDGRLCFSGAHEDFLLCSGRTGTCRYVPTPGTWLGINAEISIGLWANELRLDPGDLLVLFTDGVTEARRDHEYFGLDRLSAEIRARRELTVAQIQEDLMQAVLDFGGAPPQDDVTLLVMRYTS